MKKTKLITLLCSICLIVAMVACAAPAPLPPEEEGPPTPPPEVETLKIGVTLPLGNPMGIASKHFYDLVVPKFNEAGGLVVKGQRYNVEMIIYDDKYTAEGGRAAVERLVYQDGVKYIFQLGSAPTMGGLTVTEPEKVLVLSGASTSKLVAPEIHYAVRSAPTGTALIGKLIPILEQYPNLKTCVALAPDDETGHHLAAETAEGFRLLGLQQVEELYYPRDIVDWAPIGTKIASINPDLLETACGSTGGADEGLMYQAAYDAGWRGLKSGRLTDLKALREVCSEEAIGEALGKVMLPDTPNPPEISRKYKEAYIEKYGEWDSNSIQFCGSWYLFLAAVKKADSLEVDDILAAMEGIEFNTPYSEAAMIKRPDLGNYRYCDVIYKETRSVFKEGELVSYFTVTIEDMVEGLGIILGCPGEYR